MKYGTAVYMYYLMALQQIVMILAATDKIIKYNLHVNELKII